MVLGPEYAGYFVYLSFIVFIFILYKAGLFKMAVNGLDNKRKEISDAIGEAEAARKKAEAIYNEYRLKMDGLQKISEDMLKNAEENAASVLREAEEKIRRFAALREEEAEKRIKRLEAEAMQRCYDYTVSKTEAAVMNTLLASNISDVSGKKNIENLKLSLEKNFLSH